MSVTIAIGHIGLMLGLFGVILIVADPGLLSAAGLVWGFGMVLTLAAWSLATHEGPRA